jgi:coenzyme F420 hydrogenase subunit beta
LTFFCAGTPSTEGTLNLLTSLNVAPTAVHKVRYRGRGWPGSFTVQYGDRGFEKSLSYVDSWGRLTPYRPLRCNLCPDGLGRTADISCGDAWERLDRENDIGRSIVLVRTERGRQILHRAIAAGCVELERVDHRAVFSAQPQLLQRRRELFGRLLGMQILGIPTPKFFGFSLIHCWIRQPLVVQLRSLVGTIRRSLQRGWWTRRPGTRR